MDEASSGSNNTPLILGGCVGCLFILVCLGGFAGVGAMFYARSAPAPMYDDVYYPE